MGDNEISDNINEGESLAISIAMAMQRYNAGAFLNRARPGLHWKPLDAAGKCLCCIAPAAAMVNKFVETTQNTNKKQLLASNYGTFWALVVSENCIPQNGPSTQVIDATSFV